MRRKDTIEQMKNGDAMSARSSTVKVRKLNSFKRELSSEKADALSGKKTKSIILNAKAQSTQ